MKLRKVKKAFVQVDRIGVADNHHFSVHLLLLSKRLIHPYEN